MADREEEQMNNKDKIILDLCGGTGAWSKPYAKAGYDVRVITLPFYNVLKFSPPDDVYGILAAPPCTQFSFARTNAKKQRDFKKGMTIVEACLKIIWQCRFKNHLSFWALENPKGYLRQFLGKPVLEFDPFEYGDPYIKRTDLWGYFNLPKRNVVDIPDDERIKFTTNSQRLKSVELATLFNPNGYHLAGDMDKRQVRRAITPSGFAYQFFKANQ